MVSTIASLA